MDRVLSIIKYTFIQQWRNRIYLVVVLFGFLMLGASLLFGALAADQEVRVIFNFGLATIEFFGVVAAVFGAVTLILEEMEARTLYLLLSRPVPRWNYILGRFLGLLLAVWVSMGVMSAGHLLLLYAKGWQTDPSYFLSLPLMQLKVMMVVSLAVFFALFSSSNISAVVFTFFVWVLGHFGPEFQHLVEKSHNGVAIFFGKVFVWVMPQFQWLNYKDYFHTPDFLLSSLVGGVGYAFVYAAAWLFLSLYLFSRKEF